MYLSFEIREDSEPMNNMLRHGVEYKIGSLDTHFGCFPERQRCADKIECHHENPASHSPLSTGFVMASDGPYSRLWVYHTKHHMYIVGSHRNTPSFGVLRINRHDGAQLKAMELPMAYDVQGINRLLRQLHSTNAHHGGLVFVTKVRSWPDTGTERHPCSIMLR